MISNTTQTSIPPDTPSPAPPTTIAKPEWKLSAFTQPTDIFTPTDSRIKQDILLMLLQYLQDEGCVAAAQVLLDELNLKAGERLDHQAEIRRMKKAIGEGDWAEVDRLGARPWMRGFKGFLYSVYEQQYLEYIHHHEIQKAFTHLNKRMKPLEHLQRTPTEFKELCYLLTANSVQESPSFKNWEGVGPSREKLVEVFQSMIDFEVAEREGSIYLPPHRLITLLQQAVAYQVETSRYHNDGCAPSPKITTLLYNHSTSLVPNAILRTYSGHTGAVKCAKFVGTDGARIMGCGSDHTLRIWETEGGGPTLVLDKHASKVWDCTSRADGGFVASGSGDATIKLWDIRGAAQTCVATLAGHEGDVYSVQYHPQGDYLVSGGYDKIVRLYDVERGTITKTFTGHSLSVSSATFTPLGNLIVSGSKDSTIKFWDIVSGLCIKTISSHLGEVTNVELSQNGLYLLSSSKDNSNRLWDVRMLRPIQKFKGHQNTSKNFIRSSFSGDSLVVGGSEDGVVFVWDRENGKVLERLKHHSGVVYSVNWNAKQSLFLSGSEDGTVATWHFKPK